jgi:hypothetical protein
MPNSESKSSPPTLSTDSSRIDVTTEHSNASFHQQLLDGLDSITLTDSKSHQSKPAGMPMLTPANSVSVGDDFDVFDPIGTVSPAVAASTNVISEIDGSKNKKTDDDLWSDFESFRSSESNAAGPASKPTPSLDAFDDWAKF